MNGTIVVDGFTVSRAGKSTKITGPRELPRAEFRRLKAKADAMLSAGPGNERVDAFHDELPGLLARAQRIEKISPYRPSPSDNARRDEWGRKNAPRWSGFNCLAASIATALGIENASTVPDPQTREYERDGEWLPAYNARLSEALGYRLVELAKATCPPRGTWVAGLDCEPEAHAVVARQAWCVWDPARELTQSPLPLKQLLGGFVLQPSYRFVWDVRPGCRGWRKLAA